MSPGTLRVYRVVTFLPTSEITTTSKSVLDTLDIQSQGRTLESLCRSWDFQESRHVYMKTYKTIQAQYRQQRRSLSSRLSEWI